MTSVTKFYLHFYREIFSDEKDYNLYEKIERSIRVIILAITILSLYGFYNNYSFYVDSKSDYEVVRFVGKAKFSVGGNLKRSNRSIDFYIFDDKLNRWAGVNLTPLPIINYDQVYKLDGDCVVIDFVEGRQEKWQRVIYLQMCSGEILGSMSLSDFDSGLRVFSEQRLFFLYLSFINFFAFAIYPFFINYIIKVVRK
jgi:hypothetical protein